MSVLVLFPRKVFRVSTVLFIQNLAINVGHYAISVSHESHKTFTCRHLIVALLSSILNLIGRENHARIFTSQNAHFTLNKRLFHAFSCPLFLLKYK